VNVTQDYAPGTGADASLSPILKPGNWRAVLTWNAAPRDLDTHVIIPGGCHVYYRNRRCTSGSAITNLDVDATQGYGPETTTFDNLSNGLYRYYVYIFAPADGSFIPSNGRVMIYNEQGLQRDVAVPTFGYLTNYKYWDVFTINYQNGVASFNVTNRVLATI